MASRDMEAKIVVLGASGVGKTSLLTRYIHNTFHPPEAATPTVGATFLTKRHLCPDTHPPTTIRLQIWDTAGQERFRSISALYYRGAHAALLCYDITSAASFDEMAGWLAELRRACTADCLIHVVGTKADIVADDPRARAVPFERCIQYVAEQLHGDALREAAAAAAGAQRANSISMVGSPGGGWAEDARNSGVWDVEPAWDSCHEISAKDGEGVDEVFRVIARKLVERRDEEERKRSLEQGAAGTEEEELFEGAMNKKGSFKLGIGDKRRSWLGLPGAVVGISNAGGAAGSRDQGARGRCC